MSTPTNHWKLGLFVVIGVLLGLASVVYFGARSIPKETVTYASYFDEAVTGLEIGSPIKFRGVTIGTVSRIDLAADRRHVKISYELTVGVLRQLGIARTTGEKTRLPMAPNLRAQLSSTGITGVKFVQLDFFEDGTPIDALPFAVSGNYIPTTPSSMKNIEVSVVHAADRLPELTDQLVVLLARVNRVSSEVEAQRLPDRVGLVLAHADHTLTSLDEKLDALDLRGLSNDTRATLSSLNGTANRANQLLDQVSGDKGLLASAQRVTEQLGDTARNASGFGNQFEQTLRDVSEAADSIKDLADALE
ncbi:MAG TPA: MlaD family protein, partial [Polyangiales bacterium]|nr:MlaD family protein [Polyangiales bacterium]